MTNYDEYIESNNKSVKTEIDKAIEHAKWNLSSLETEILWWKKADFKTPDSIDNFYKIENWKIVFQLSQIKNYLSDVYKRLSWMKVQKFWEVSKENNFTWTILAIQIALKSFETDPMNPRKYNVGPINWEYNESTKFAINQFQTDYKLQWKDGKPWKETIWRIVKELDNLLNNKKLERNEQEILKTDVASIIEESVNNSWFSWLKENIIDYIVKWNLNTWKNLPIESQIKILANNPLNYKLKYLLDHSNEQVQTNIQKIKNIENKNGVTSPRSFDKYTSWANLTEWQKNTITNVLSQWESPVTAEMVADSCKTTNVPVEYLLWFMQNDSKVWTMGLWAKTHNPGNVWNTGRAKKDRWTWEKWVEACANNLQKRINAYLNAKKQHNGKWFNDFPTPEELATWKTKWWFKFFWIYMTASDWPRKVAWMVNKRVNRLEWK